MRKSIKILFLTVLAIMAIMPAAAQKSKGLEISFDYERQSGPGSNQYAIWVENMDGQVVRTLFVTSFTTKGRTRGGQQPARGYTFRPDCVPTWVRNAKAEELTDQQIDGFTGATPQSSGRQTFAWDFKDSQGNTVAKGKYKIFLEATLYNKSIVTYSGTFSTDGKAGDVKLDKTLTQEDASHARMIDNVKAVLK
ncbi:MAG: DUF2271 domain-containing protein [Bacteroidaceae bacterium]|nr:DUF2271 domain-containing protein [Bacteroidaceae bacterium]